MGGVIDLEQALHYIGGDEAFLHELVGLFLETTGEVVDRVRESASLRRSRELEEAAHRLRGALLNVHAAPAAKVCAQVEIAARASDWPVIEECTPSLFIHLDRVYGALQLAVEL